MELFEDRLNFTFGSGALESEFQIRERAPRKGKRPLYKLVRDTGARLADSAVIVLLPDLREQPPDSVPTVEILIRAAGVAGTRAASEVAAMRIPKR